MWLAGDPGMQRGLLWLIYSPSPKKAVLPRSRGMFDLDRPSLPFKSARSEATLAYSEIYRMFSERVTVTSQIVPRLK